MSERKRLCIRGHDTFLIGRDSSHRCLACKRETMYEARKAREAEEAAVRHAEREAMRAEEEKLRKAERARIIAAGGPDAKELRWDERSGARCRRPRSVCASGLSQTVAPADAFSEPNSMATSSTAPSTAASSRSRRHHGIN
jgi:hypothetical protein